FSSTSTTYNTSVSTREEKWPKWSLPRPPVPTTATPIFSLGLLLWAGTSAASTSADALAATAAAAANIQSSKNCRRVRSVMVRKLLGIEIETILGVSRWVPLRITPGKRLVSPARSLAKGRIGDCKVATRWAPKEAQDCTVGPSVILCHEAIHQP